MKILIINTHFSQSMGGSEIQSHLVAEHMSKRGHVVAYYSPSPTYSKTMWDGYELINKKLDRHNFSEILREFNPDIIYWRYNLRNFLMAGRLSWTLGIPLIFAVSHYQDLEKWKIKKTGNRVEKLFHLKRKLSHRINYSGLRYSHAIVINNPNFFKYQDTVKKQFRLIFNSYIPNSEADSAKNIQKNKFLLWASNIKASKNPEILFRLAKKLKELNINIIAIGDVQEAIYHRKFEGFNADNLHFLGKRDYFEINNYLKCSLFTIHTGEEEGFSNFMIQSWSNGKPVISLIHDPGKFISNFNIGYVADGNYGNFEKKVLELLSNFETITSYTENCKKVSEKYFNLIKNMNELEKLITEIVGN